MRDIEAPNHLLRLFEEVIEVALQEGNTHSGEDWNGNPNGSPIDRTISELLFDEHIHGMGQSMLESTELHTIWQTQGPI